MTEAKLIETILKVAPQVFDCAPDGPGAQRRAEVIAACLYVKGVVVPTCRCYECKHSQPSRTPNHLLCARRSGGLVRLDGYCDEAQEKDEMEEIITRAEREAALLTMKKAMEAHEKWKASHPRPKHNHKEEENA